MNKQEMVENELYNEAFKMMLEGDVEYPSCYIKKHITELFYSNYIPDEDFSMFLYESDLDFANNENTELYEIVEWLINERL